MQQGQKNKAVVTETSSPNVKRKQTGQRRISPGPFDQPMGVGSGSKPPVAVEAMEVSDTLDQAAREPGKLKDHVIVGLEQLLEWVKKQTEPDYKALLADLKVVQGQAERMKAEVVVMSKAVSDLRAQKEILQQ